MFTSKFNLSRAATRSKFDLSEQLLTTLDFGQIVPFYSRAILPSDEFTVNTNIFSRVAPLAAPAYVDASLVAVSVFVPYYQVYDGIESFLSGQKMHNSSSVRLPSVRLSVIEQLYIKSETKDYFWVDGTIDRHDYCRPIHSVNTNNPSFKYYRFTRFGKYVFKILQGLGYQLCPHNFTYSEPYNNYTYNKKLNFLPLMCFFKAYHDWFSSMYRYENSVMARRLQQWRNGTDPDWEALAECFKTLYLLYDSDYVTTAWRNTNSPYYLDTNGPSIDNPGLKANQDSTHFQTEGNTTAKSIRMLLAFDNYIRRNNYSGTKPALRALSRWGIKTEDYKTNYADVLGIQSVPLQIGDVTQTSQSTNGDDGSPLGSYGGKGIANGSDTVHFKSTDYGHFFIIGFINVKTSYPWAFDTECLKTDVYDFYNPEFDGIGSQPLSQLEVCSDPRYTSVSDHDSSDLVFGFTERYNEYRFGRNRITGDFLTDPTLNLWHTARDCSHFFFKNVTAQSDEAIFYSNRHSSPFNRIFALNDSDDVPESVYDHFFLQCHFKISAIRPVKNLSQAINLGDGEITLDKNGNVIN